MGERIRHHVFLRSSLQSVISNGRCRPQCGLHIPAFNKLPLLLGAIGPDAGKAVRLQLNSDLQAISFDLIHSALRLLQLGQQPQLILHVVSDLMGNHIGFGELTRLAADIASLETPLEVLKKS